MSAPENKAFILTGPSVADWSANGQKVPGDAVIDPCMNCGESITISKAAAIKAMKKYPKYRVAILCRPCEAKLRERLADVISAKTVQAAIILRATRKEDQP